MGGWHLPMATVEEETTTDGGSSRLDTKLSEVGTDVPDSLFTDIFEPGDWVDTESGPYRVGIDGRLEAVSPYPRYEASHKSPIPVVPIAVAGISGALVFLLASRWARSRGRDSGAGAVLERRR